MAKQKSASKKKGPKGKQARAKAKLDRQWGETAIIDDEKPRRVGKSRLKAKLKSDEKIIRWAEQQTEEEATRNDTPEYSLPPITNEKNGRQHKPSGSMRKGRNSRNAFISDDSDDSALEDEDESGVQGLLDAIKNSKEMAPPSRTQSRKRDNHVDGNDHEQMQEEPTSDVDMETSEDESSDDDPEPVESDNEEDMDDCLGNSDQIDDASNMDLFYGHFGRDPIPSETLKDILSLENHKINVDSNTQLQIARPDKIHDAASPFSSETSFEDLKRLAASAFDGNRKLLQTRWKKLFKVLMSDRQASIYPCVARYMDMLVTTESRKHRKEVQYLNLVHVLNHVMTSRSRIQRHNRQLKESEEKASQEDDDVSESANETDTDRFRDQGFTRPTVLILLPNRGTCHNLVRGLLKMVGVDTADNPHVERFDGEFGPINEKSDDEDDTTPIDAQKELRRKAVLEKKGKDWNEFFGDDVNQDDDFKIGIALTPKAAKSKKNQTSSSSPSKVQVKLYTDFYKSDIIVGSPLGLKMLLAPDEDGKQGDSDYLSSIEICLVQHADIMMMQNWDHVNDVLSALNQAPQKNNDTDFSRVRKYMLEGQADRWRQLILSTDIIDPSLQSAFKRFGKSIAGSAKVRRKTAPEEAALANVLLPMKQVFQRAPVASFDQQTDARVQYFVKHVLPQIQQHKQKHTMVYIPSYFDFVALRNIFLKREIAFVSVHEYSRHTEVSRARARFLQGRKPILLYTGRANFFHRHAIKGIRHLIFLGLPEHPQFYSDQVNLIETAMAMDEEGEQMAGSSCLALFTRFEGHALERVVGSTNSSRMIKSDKGTFMFHS